MTTADSTARPLAGRHIVITRPPERAPGMRRALEDAGARVTALPAIAIAPSDDDENLDAALRELATYDWIVFTSVNGVRALDKRLAALGLTWDTRGRARVAAIGPATARALAAAGAPAEVVPAEYVAEAIVEALGNVAGQRILLPRADIARKALAQELAVRGADVTEVAAYRTVPRRIPPKELARALDAGRPDAITFTSSSTVLGLLQSLDAARRAPEEALRGVALAAIGPITAATLREHGLEPAIVAAEYTMPGLVQALVEYFAGAPPHMGTPSVGEARPEFDPRRCRVVERLPTLAEYRGLRTAVGWENQDPDAATRALQNALFSVCVEYEGEVIGCGRVIGDDGLYYYLQDIIVRPERQGRGVGGLLMDAIMAYIRAHARSGAFIGLMAAQGVAGFYVRYGFAARPSEHHGPGMQMWAP